MKRATGKTQWNEVGEDKLKELAKDKLLKK